MSIGIKHVHIGREIDKRRLELGISKSELGRCTGNVPQQHINCILEKPSTQANLYRYKCGLGRISLICMLLICTTYLHIWQQYPFMEMPII